MLCSLLHSNSPDIQVTWFKRNGEMTSTNITQKPPQKKKILSVIISQHSGPLQTTQGWEGISPQSTPSWNSSSSSPISHLTLPTEKPSTLRCNQSSFCVSALIFLFVIFLQISCKTQLPNGFPRSEGVYKEELIRN